MFRYEVAMIDQLLLALFKVWFVLLLKLHYFNLMYVLTKVKRSNSNMHANALNEHDLNGFLNT